jgi:Winged helix DNA-binding domain
MSAGLTWDRVRRRRLQRHSLVERAPAARLAEVVGETCGIHAQLITAAELSIGVRVEGTRRAVRMALWEERRLVKTYGIRGTIHLFPAGELPLWMAARSHGSALNAELETSRLNNAGLGPEQARELVEATGQALDGRILTLRELGEEVVKRTGPWAAEAGNDAWVSGWPNWRRALGSAAKAGVLCFGPNRGNRVTFARADQWIGGWEQAEPEEALREVFRRYLRAYGPATADHFGQWFDLSPRVARRLASEMRQELAEVTVEGQTLLLPAEDAGAGAAEGAEVDGGPAGGPARLLPHFDCYLRGFHPRAQLVGAHGDRAAGGTGRFPVLLVDGQVAGVWERRQRSRRLEIRIDVFGRSSRHLSRQLRLEVARLGAFDEMEAELTTGPVEVRAHL